MNTFAMSSAFPPWSVENAEAGTATESGADPSGATPGTVPGGERKPKMSHTRTGWAAAKESFPPNT